MQTLTIEITNKNALKLLQNLEELHLIRILKDSQINSLVLPGEPISDEDFRKWVEYTEGLPTISLTEAKQRWQLQKEKLQKLIH